MSPANSPAPATIACFRKKVYYYYACHGRRLPWRQTTDPYKILVSEVMLQQTQVARVIEKYAQFVKRFPTIRHLAKAPLRQVLKCWQGLGYNRRPVLLKRLAQQVVSSHDGVIPETAEALQVLPGIGKATASSICVFAFNQPHVFIETNIRSVFIHHFFNDKENISDRMLEPFIKAALDVRNPRKWYSALMDYGVFLKSSISNPGRKSSHYKKQSPFKGSDRQLRGEIVRLLLKGQNASLASLVSSCGQSREKTHRILSDLCREGIIRKSGAYFSL